MSASKLAAHQASAIASQSAASSSTSSTTSSVADRELFFATKYRNFGLFVTHLAEYLPDAETWATALRTMPLIAFKLQARGYFAAAIEAHLRGDNQGRDCAASAVIRQQANDNGVVLTKIRAEDYSRLLRYASLFSILLAEDFASEQ